MKTGSALIKRWVAIDANVIFVATVRRQKSELVAARRWTNSIHQVVESQAVDLQEESRRCNQQDVQSCIHEAKHHTIDHLDTSFREEFHPSISNTVGLIKS